MRYLVRSPHVSSITLAFMLSACVGNTRSPASGSAHSAGITIVGPQSGSVLVVGGGAQGPEVFAKFIELAGGPDALIVDVPTAGGDSVDVSTAGRGLRAAGARNVVVYHTTSRAVADADTFVAKIANARGVWFGGGRHFRLVNSYMGTKSQRAFEAVLARGGVVGGSSAGASILGSYLVRGAPSNDNRIMSHPQYLEGFGYLRNTAIDQHVVARERLADLHDSVTSKRPDLLGISEDEGTAWVVRGDTGEIIGRNKAFVYNGRDANDDGKPYLTLRAGDRYNLATRRVISRATAATPLTQRHVDRLLAPWSDSTRGGAAIVVAINGKVLVNSAYGIAPQRRYMPETAMPNMPLRELSAVLQGAVQADSGGRMTAASIRRLMTIGGMQRVAYDSTQRQWNANVDDLYRFEIGRTLQQRTTTELAAFTTDTLHGHARQVAYGAPNGRRAAWVRYPEQRAVIILLTNDDSAAAKQITDRIGARLFPK